MRRTAKGGKFASSKLSICKVKQLHEKQDKMPRGQQRIQQRGAAGEKTFEPVKGRNLKP